MRLAALFFRSRRAGYAAVILAFVAALCWAAGHMLLARPVVVVGYLAPVLVFGALLAACVVTAGAGSSLGEVERTASFPLPALRSAHLGALLTAGAVAFTVVALAWDRTSAAAVLLRGLLGLSGMSFLAAFVLGSRLSWALPVGFVVAVPLVGDGSGGSRWAWWAWVDQKADDPLSWTLAMVLFAVGFGLACFLETPEAPDRVR